MFIPPKWQLFGLKKEISYINLFLDPKKLFMLFKEINKFFSDLETNK